MGKKEKVSLALDAPRIVTLKGKSTKYVYHLRRVGQQDWLTYYGSIVHQIIQRDGEREELFESDSALLEMVDRVITKVDGYGDLALSWAQLPIRHRLAVGISLRSVSVSRSANSRPNIPDQVEVVLDATWPAGDKTLIYSGLIHRFRVPSIHDSKRFNFEVARVRVRGTADDGVSIYPSRQAIAMKLYDDLIESVDGYSVDGKPLTDVETIKREMDGAHKAAAALEIFLGGEEVSIA